jgi:AcrR family transcriptional regulator
MMFWVDICGTGLGGYMKENPDNNISDRRVRKTKKQLRLALTSLLAQKGIGEITVREITDLSDINRSTFYNHYRDVYDMLEQVEKQAIWDLEEIMAVHGPLALRDRDFSRLLAALGGYLDDYRDMRVLMGRFGDPEHMERIKGILRSFLHEWYVSVFGGKNARDSFYMYHQEFVIAGSIGMIDLWLGGKVAGDPGLFAEIWFQILSKVMMPSSAPEDSSQD